MDTQVFFSRNPVFKRKQFEEAVCDDGSSSRESVAQLLQYHKNQGHIVKVKKNLYASVPPGRDPETYPVDPFLLAGFMNEDAVIGYHTALELHGHAHSVHHRYLYLTEKTNHPFVFRGTTFKPVSFPSSLVKHNEQTLEVETMDREGISIHVTTLERTLVDLLDRPRYSGGWEEIWRSFQGIGYLKMERLISYVETLNNRTTSAKVGFFLEHNQDRLSVREEDLKKLETYAPDDTRYMDRSFDEGTMQSRWNLIVPDYVLERGWEEQP